MTGKDAYGRLDEWLRTFAGYSSHVAQADVPGAGKGLVALSSKQASESLLVVPAAALLNPLTLLAHPENNIPARLFPRPSHHPGQTSKASYSQATKHREKRRRISSTATCLNTTQLLTLHVYLSRDVKSRFPSPWAVYLDTVPQNFDEHPLAWLVKGDPRIEDVPKAGRMAVSKVKDRFDLDLAVLSNTLATEDAFRSHNLDLDLDNFLWAWLIVNTRSVSLPLGYSGPTELYNHTLVPILDLANHSSTPTILKPRQIPCPGSRAKKPPGRPGPAPAGEVHLVPGRIAYDLRAGPDGLKQGEELRFEYHGLGNTDMWAEYGFAESPVESTPAHDDRAPPRSSPRSPTSSPADGRAGAWSEMKYSGVNVDHLVRPLWASRPDDPARESALRHINCWDHNHLHPWPSAEASWGLLMTLRVHYLTDIEARDKLSAISKGLVSYVSEKNEAKVRQALRDMCQTCLDEVDAWKARKRAADGTKQLDRGTQLLWDEQEAVARACLEIYS